MNHDEGIRLEEEDAVLRWLCALWAKERHADMVELSTELHQSPVKHRVFGVF